MDTLVQANIFFFITSLAVVFVSLFVILLLIKLRQLTKSVSLLVEKLKDTSDHMSEEAKDLVEDIKQSPIFRLIFPRRKKRQSSGSVKPQIPKIRRKV